VKFSWTYLEDAPIRVRTFLAFNEVSRALIVVAKYHGGDILLDGEHVFTTVMMHKGQTVTLVLPDEKGSDTVDRCDEPIDILYEDQDYLVLNKPAGVASVPAHHVVTADSLVNRVKGYYLRQHYANQVTHIATRLDKDTSGIVVFPKHHFAHSVMDKQLKKHMVQKDYVAIVSGRLVADHGLIDAPIGRDPESFVKRQVLRDGKPSETEYWVVKRMPAATVVKIRLHTGRTHQIRVHMAYLGHPLVGDQMYAGPQWIARQALHCERIKFYSPFKQRWIEIRCPLADDIQQVLNS
jgi:pseudouridine synthase, RluA family